MASIRIGEQTFPMGPFGPTEIGFLRNFCVRLLVFRYGMSMAEVNESAIACVLHDLDAVRYLAWLRLRSAGVSLEKVGEWITDANAPDAFEALGHGVEAPTGMVRMEGTADEQLAQVNARRVAAGMEPLKVSRRFGKPKPTGAADGQAET